MKYTVTNDSVSVVLDGEMYTARRGAANFDALRAAVLAGDEDGARRNRTVGRTVKEWLKAPFHLIGGTVYHGERMLPESLTQRIIATAEEGHSPESLLRFWERLSQNPSSRSVEQLFPFLQHEAIPLDQNGYILAYKGVRSDLKDVHSRTFDNSPGNIHEMQRNLISDDPNHGCHFGFHVGSLGYATNFGERTVIVRVDPADVVCIPYDHSFQKMRVCRYEVVGHYTGALPSTVIDQDDLPSIEAVEEDAVAVPSAGIKVNRRWRRVHALDRQGLMGEPLDLLRKYAVHALKLVGVYRLSGGKTALVDEIVRLRGDGG